MKEERYAQHLRDMLRASRDAVSFVEGVSETEFLADQKTQYAVIMCLHVIGESAARLADQHESFVRANPELNVYAMRGMRNRIAHGYYLINLQRVWETVRDDLRPLIDQLEGILNGSV